MLDTQYVEWYNMNITSIFGRSCMNELWNRVLLLFGKDDIWTRTNLLRSVKDEKLIDEAISMGYIEQYDINDIGDPRYRITELGAKIRNN